MPFSVGESLKILLCIWMIVYHSDALPTNNYTALRDSLINEEKSVAFGAKIKLTGYEIPANECLMAAKWKEVDEGFDNPTKFLPAKNFLSARADIEKSEVFKILRKMPKGVVFHAHASAITSLDFIMNNMTNLPDLYICRDKGALRFRFFKEPDTSCNWELLQNVRKSDANIDEMIRSSLELIDDNTKEVNAVWEKFESILNIMSGLVNYRPLFERFLYAGMQELYDDNVMLMEIRSGKSELYELNGTTYDHMHVLQIYKDVSDKFVKEHPGFLGLKVIYAPYRKVSQEKFDVYVRIFRQMKAAYPDFVIGFDLVGQEDKGHPLIDFADKLQELGKETPFFFHAGETNWYGHSTDENLYDVVLLNTKRIGHGFALLKHPKLMRIVKEKKICIELNPISNQVLALVEDMRNHPASYFFARNFPVVVSNDDPNLWGSKGLSYDFYETFIGIMSRDADLKALKQLAKNSITYSGMTQKEQDNALKIWNEAWAKFVKSLARRCS